MPCEHIRLAVGGFSFPGPHALFSVLDLLAAGFHHPCGQDECQNVTQDPAHEPRIHLYQPSHRGENHESRKIQQSNDICV